MQPKDRLPYTSPTRSSVHEVDTSGTMAASDLHCSMHHIPWTTLTTQPLHTTYPKERSQYQINMRAIAYRRSPHLHHHLNCTQPTPSHSRPKPNPARCKSTVPSSSSAHTPIANGAGGTQTRSVHSPTRFVFLFLVWLSATLSLLPPSHLVRLLRKCDLPCTQDQNPRPRPTTPK